MITMRIKALFFDRPAVQRAVDKATRRALNRAGGAIRLTARRSLRKRRRVSAPGEPPSSHEGSLRRLIFYGYDQASQSVVIGPLRFKRGEAPPLLEFGGRVTTKRPRRICIEGVGRDRRGRFTRRRFKRVPAGTKLEYKPRPFMGPALAKQRPKLPKLWANSVRGG